MYKDCGQEEFSRGRVKDISGKRIILHIGPSKTGTTALQKFFADNKEALEHIGVGYFIPENRYNPWITYANAALFMREALDRLGEASGKDEYWNEQNLNADKKAFTAYCSRYSMLILSEEIIWSAGLKRPEFWTKIRDLILESAGHGVTIDVIVYLRRQDERAFSFWKESMRGDNPVEDEDFPTTLKRMEEEGEMDYEGGLRLIEDAFGREHVFARSYHDVAKTCDGIVRDFLGKADIVCSEEMQITDRITHPSYPANLTEALRLIKRGEVKCDASWNSVRYAANQIFKFSDSKSAEYPLPYKARRALLDKYRDSNCQVARKYLGRDELFSDEIEEYEVWTPDQERDFRNAKALASMAEHFESMRSGGF